MIIVAGYFRVAPADRIAFLENRKASLLRSRGEKGCHVYVVSPDPIDPGLVNLYERWETEEDLAAHAAANRGQPAPAGRHRRPGIGTAQVRDRPGFPAGGLSQCTEPAAGPPVIVEHLSEREREVLTVLSGRMTTAEVFAGDMTPDRTQRLLNHASWDAPAAMGVLRRFGAAGLEAAARKHGRQGRMKILALDETGRRRKAKKLPA